MIKKMAINNFYKGTTKKFTGTITYNSSTPDITSDTVTFIVKTNKSDSDANAVINVTADVSGGSGQYTVTVTDTETDVDVKKYYYELVWELSSGEEYVLEQGTVDVFERVQDV